MTIILSTAYEGEIDSWDTLKSYITEETDGRADATQLAAYIRRAENRILRALAIRPVSPMETSVSIVTTAEVITGPSDMVRPFGLELADGANRQEIDYVSPENMSALQLQNSARAQSYEATDGSGYYPRYYTTINSDIRFWPPPSTSRTGTLYYYQQLPFLSAENQTNWLLQSHADVYLDGSLYYAYRAMPDIEKASLMKDIFEQSLSEALEAYPNPANRIEMTADVMLTSRRFNGPYGYPY